MFKRGLFVFGIFVILLSGISADECVIKSRASCSDNIVMGLSSEENAHGELASQGNYDYVLCCDFGFGSTSCDGSNTIVKLSSQTNAHAEIPKEGNYDYNVCYEKVSCVSRTGSCESDEVGIISLTSETNAHLADYGVYENGICCSTEEGPQKSAHWSNTKGNYISSAITIPELTQVVLVLENSGLTEGTDVEFNIYEVDVLNDDLIRTLSGSVGSDGNANATWTITQADLDATGESDFDEFYFTAEEETSNLLTLTIENASFCSDIVLCGNYEEEARCNQDPCAVADFSIENKNTGVSCGEDTFCGCYWNSSNVCVPVLTSYSDDIDNDGIPNIDDADIDGDGILNGDDPDVNGDGTVDQWGDLIGDGSGDIDNDGKLDINDEDIDGDGILNGDDPDVNGDGIPDYLDWGVDFLIGRCLYDENSGSDDCGDGFLTYSWLAKWEWGQNNTKHVDPEGKSLECVEGSKTIPCPAQIKLSFFGTFNMIIAFIVIITIYCLLNRKLK